MAIPSSGAISMSMFNTELGRSSNTANSSLAGGSTPAVGSLFWLANQSGSLNQTSPHSMSEWYGYSAATNIYVVVIVPATMTCGQYYTFCAYVSGGTNVNTAVQVQIGWNGDLGGYVYGTVDISSGNNCGSNINIYSGGGVNCGGENYSTASPATISPTSSGTYNYFINYVTTDNVDFCPC